MGDIGLRMNMFMRSFFIQSSWSFDRLQNLGFAFLLYPAVRRRHGTDAAATGAAMVKHLELFNTHPYFAGLVAGAISAEEGGEIDRDRYLNDMKRSLMSALGSVGDSFFWATLKPLSALAALLCFLLDLRGAPLVMLALYNGPHLAIRWKGVTAGLRRGRYVLQSLENLALPERVPLLRGALAAAAGLCAGAAALHPDWKTLPGHDMYSALTGPAIFFAAALATWKKGGSGRGAAR